MRLMKSLLACILVPACLLVSLALASGRDEDVASTSQPSTGHDESSPLLYLPSHPLVAPDAYPLRGTTAAPMQIDPIRDPSSSQPFHTLPAPASHPSGFEPHIVVMPPLDSAEVTQHELYHLWRSMRYKLDRLRINPSTLTMAQPMPEIQPIHLSLLRNTLQTQINLKKVIFVTPTMDHKARIFAMPIVNDRFKTVVLERLPSDKVAWAFVAIKGRERPAASWYAYALHDVMDREDVEEMLEDGKRVRALSDYLRPTV